MGCKANEIAKATLSCIIVKTTVEASFDLSITSPENARTKILRQAEKAFDAYDGIFFVTFIGPKMFDLEMELSLTGKLDNAQLTPFDMYFLESTLLNLMANELKKYPNGIFISNISNTVYDFQIAQEDGRNDTLNLRATINGVILSNWPGFSLNYFALNSFSNSLPSLIDSLTSYSRFQGLDSVTCNILSGKSDRKVVDSTSLTLIIISILFCLSFFGISILIAFRKSTEDRKDKKLSQENEISIESDIESSKADVEVGSFTKSASVLNKRTRSSSPDDSTSSKTVLLTTQESENEDEINSLKECAPTGLIVNDTRKKYDGKRKVARRHSISYKPSSSEQLERKTVGRRQLITGEQTLVKQEKNVRRHSISDKPSSFAQKEREITEKRKVVRRHSISDKPSLFEQQESGKTGKRKVVRRHSISDKPSTLG